MTRERERKKKQHPKKKKKRKNFVGGVLCHDYKINYKLDLSETITNHYSTSSSCLLIIFRLS